MVLILLSTPFQKAAHICLNPEMYFSASFHTSPEPHYIWHTAHKFFLVPSSYHIRSWFYLSPRYAQLRQGWVWGHAEQWVWVLCMGECFYRSLREIRMKQCLLQMPWALLLPWYPIWNMKEWERDQRPKKYAWISWCWRWCFFCFFLPDARLINKPFIKLKWSYQRLLPVTL